jgi:hypothetical protein
MHLALTTPVAVPHSMTATSTGNVIDHSSGGIVPSLKMFATNERTKIEF